MFEQHTSRKNSMSERKHIRFFLLLLFVFTVTYLPLSPIASLTTRSAFAEDPPGDDMGSSFHDGEEITFEEDQTVTSINPTPQPKSQTQRPQPFLGDPPPEDELPTPLSVTSPEEALAPVVVSANIGDNGVKLRNGPGLEYNTMRYLEAGTPVKIIGRFGDWVQVQLATDTMHYWVSSEMVDISDYALYTLFEVPASEIPFPMQNTATVAAEELPLYEGPGSEYASPTTLKAGDKLELIERYGDWLYITYGDYQGWVNIEFLNVAATILHRVPESTLTAEDLAVEAEEETEALPMTARVNDSNVNLREGPGTLYRHIGNIDAETTVELLAQYEDWYQIKLEDGAIAWVFGDLLNISPSVRQQVPAAQTIPELPASAEIHPSGDVASYAMQYVGHPYVYGGTTPGGFDCSGFVQYVYAQHGIHLPRTAAEQYSTTYGIEVASMYDLAPGDIMFFVNTSTAGISHVAIYTGNGRMVHAISYETGVGVSDIWDPYWVNHYYGAIRVRR